MNIQETLQERGKRYGSYSNVAAMSNELMRVIEHGASIDEISDEQRFALIMITNKIARAVNGDPSYDDNWRDIAGYATLVLESLKGRA